MAVITDEFMKEMMTKSKTYSLVILKAGPVEITPDKRPIVREHGRKNFSLRDDGLLSIVCPITEDANVKGIGIFNVDKTALHKIMEEDPGVKEGYSLMKYYPAGAFPVMHCRAEIHFTTDGFI